jgi:hypothetical protein
MQDTLKGRALRLLRRATLSAVTLIGTSLIVLTFYQLAGVTNAQAGCVGLACGDQASCGTACFCNISPPGDGTCHAQGQ